jgi:hypothetical protein
VTFRNCCNNRRSCTQFGFVLDSLRDAGIFRCSLQYLRTNGNRNLVIRKSRCLHQRAEPLVLLTAVVDFAKHHDVVSVKDSSAFEGVRYAFP